MNKPDFSFERKLWNKNFVVIGLDEVGRGALAGPLTVGAVCFKSNWMDNNWKKIQQLGINDSKVLSPEKRNTLSTIIKTHALAYATASCTVETIDLYGLTKTTCDLFNIVVQQIILQLKTDLIPYVIVDGKISPMIDTFTEDRIQTIIDGDAKSISIAAASIIAKVDRDAQMTKLSDDFPDYRWDLNKGYGTRLHVEALRKHGSTILHRKKFIDSILF